jgi:DNA-binding CsgD family transcriptional regulator
VVRSQARGPYEAWELNQVRPLLPHLRRAVQVNERLSELERTQVALADSLESLRQGVVVINQRGKVFFANRAAREIVARRDGLAITADGLVPSNYADRVRLRSLLDETVQSSIGAGCSPGGAMAVARPSSKPAFLVLVAPLPLELGEGHPQGLATVFISDPDAREETAGERARRVYGLSPSEARVAQAFVATGSLALVADQLRISRGTARWHLKRIYSKTGVHRQADLLRRLARDPGRLVGETGPDDDPLSARQ